MSQNAYFEAHYGWLVLIGCMGFVISFAFGWGPIPWLLIPEITPYFARGAVTALSTALNWTTAFVVAKNYHQIQSGLKNYGVFFLFASICVVGIVFTRLAIPETKGKSVEELANLYKIKSERESMYCDNPAYDQGP